LSDGDCSVPTFGPNSRIIARSEECLSDGFEMLRGGQVRIKNRNQRLLDLRRRWHHPSAAKQDHTID
jgi:hypothetical protein